MRNRFCPVGEVGKAAEIEFAHHLIDCPIGAADDELPPPMEPIDQGVAVLLAELVGLDVAHAELRGGQVASGYGEGSVGDCFDLQSSEAAVADGWCVVHGGARPAVPGGGHC